MPGTCRNTLILQQYANLTQMFQFKSRWAAMQCCEVLHGTCLGLLPTSQGRKHCVKINFCGQIMEPHWMTKWSCRNSTVKILPTTYSNSSFCPFNCERTSCKTCFLSHKLFSTQRQTKLPTGRTLEWKQLRNRSPSCEELRALTKGKCCFPY